MQLTQTDYLLARIAHSAAGIVRRFGHLETEHLRRQLEPITIQRPVFLTGLARSGTTILLQELSNSGLFATHRYRDFPFVMTPWLWNWFLRKFSGQQTPVPRPHQDRIKITLDSPEAFEEPIWQHFFPHVHATDSVHTIDGNVSNEPFERFFREHLRKIMFVRGRGQYLSKGNYNLTRIEYLAKLFPDARFVVPVRHPVSHVVSLVRQHQLFTEYGRQDSRVSKYLAFAGHYEFGPQRVPIRLNADDGDRTVEAWNNENEHLGYAIQWAQVYRHIHSLRTNSDELRERILLVRHEDFCAQPRDVFESILEHAGVEGTGSCADQSFDHIADSTGKSQAVSEALEAEIWDTTADVAIGFGYTFHGAESELSIALTR